METDPRNYSGWAEAFTIFARYEPDAAHHVAAEHDIIYAGPEPADVSPEDKERLDVLGWHAADGLDCFFHYV